MIIITGGTGYIGKNIAFYLLSQGENVLLVDDYSRSSPDSLKSLYNKLLEYGIPRTSVYFYYLDMTDRYKMNKFFFDDLTELSKNNFVSRVKGVIHCAGFKSVSESVINPHSYYRNNIISTLNLIECLQVLNRINDQQKLPHIPIIFSSSTTVYGNNDNPLREDMECNIENVLCPYGKTKYMIEQILKDCSKYIKTVCLRYFNPIGCFEGLDEEINEHSTTIIPCLIRSVYSDTVFKIYGNDYPTKDGTCVRDFIDVRDLASAHYKALEYVNKMDGNFDVVNIGTQVGTSVKELVEEFILVKKVNIKYEYADKRQGDVAECYADSKKANEKLSWSPVYTLKQSIQSIRVNLHLDR